MMIIYCFFFSPADISFLRSISLSISLEILSSVIRISLCRSNIEVSGSSWRYSQSVCPPKSKSAEAVPTLVIGQVFPLSLRLFPTREPQTIGHHGWEEETQASRHRSCYTATISAPLWDVRGMNASTFVFCG